ncbi:MAG TPA: conjugal transfer protein TraI [Puia sp.]|nr:conjugal transfer protein TraI [Puia sp.]
MKKSILFAILVTAVTHADAQLVAGTVLSQTAGRVIRAIDLKVQRMQNQTIWLQNAQKLLENELSKLKLAEIAGWSGKQQQLYSNYYSELGQIKSYILFYRRIKDLTLKQAGLVSAYKQYWNLFHNDPHFSAAELSQMQRVYAGILDAILKNLNQIMMAVQRNQTQMSDEQRLELINKAGDRLDGNYSDLKQFNTQNEMLSLQRARDEQELLTLKQYYGIH